MSDQRRALHQILAEGPDAIASLLARNTVWHVAHPVGELHGAEAVSEHVLRPLHAALPGLTRRDELVLGNRSRVSAGEWVATLGHYVGNFTAPLWGVPPSGKLAFLRCGEFYRLDADGRIAEAFILPDLLDLLRQAGCRPVPFDLGTEMLFPGPASHDGVYPAGRDRSDRSAALVEAMLTDLRDYDRQTFQSAGQTGSGGYWHRDMLWFGPGGVGANFTYPGFDRDHRVPFLTAFPDRVGGNHFARFGDGDYVCSGGWPSMTMTHRGPYLGVPATNRALTLRVMDFWRLEDSTIRENWVLLDLLDLLLQMGVDVLAAVATDSSLKG
jgi:predicted ester cyclase